MLKLIINATGETTDDLVLAVEEAVSRIESENTSGFDRNDTGSFDFDIAEEEA